MPQKPKPLNPQLSAYDRFGAELRDRRVRRGLTQAALARTVHVHPDMVAKVEKAVRRPTRDLAVACDAALDAQGALAALWPAAVTERRGPRAPASVLAPIGRVAADPAADRRGGRASVIRLDARRYVPADLAGLERYPSVDVVWHARGRPWSGAGTPDAANTDPADFDTTAFDPAPVGLFAIPAARRPYRLTVTRCALTGVDGTAIHVRGLDAPAGAAVYDLWPGVGPEATDP